MKAFNNDSQLKADLLAEVIKHRKMDMLVSGTYGSFEDKNFKGCAVGCSLHSYGLIRGIKLDTSDHKIYEEFGIPRLLALLQDSVFEGLPKKEQQLWPEKFWGAINEGSDLSTVWPQFAQWLLTDKKWGVIQYAKTEQQRSSIQTVSVFYRDGGSINDFKIAYAAAYAAAGDAAAAAAAAAYDAAAYAAAYAAYAAGAAAKYKTRIAQSKKLISLLKAAK